MNRPHRMFKLLTQMTMALSFATAMAAPSTLSPANVSSTVLTYRVSTDEAGNETLEAATQARFGDVIEYRVVYRNVSKAPVIDLYATMPVPGGGFEYLSNTAQPGSFLASLDGENFAPVPLTRVETLPDGRREVRTVPESEYRYLRWQFRKLRGGDSVTVRARVRLAE